MSIKSVKYNISPVKVQKFKYIDSYNSSYWNGKPREKLDVVKTGFDTNYDDYLKYKVNEDKHNPFNKINYYISNHTSEDDIKKDIIAFKKKYPNDEIFSNDVNTVYNSLNDKLEEIRNSIDSTNRTDYQKVAFTSIDVLQSISNDKVGIDISKIDDKYKDYDPENPMTYQDFINKYHPTINEMIKVFEADERGSQSNYFSELSSIGYGKYKFLNCSSLDNGFDGFTLEDKNGNIIQYFCGTNGAQENDYIYDATNIYKDYSENGSRNFAFNFLTGSADFVWGIGEENNFLNKMKSGDIYAAEQQSAEEYFKYWLTYAKNNNKTLTLQSHSLSGSLAERAVLNTASDPNFSTNGKINNFGGFIEYNGFHDRLKSEEIEVLKNNGMSLYATQGDMISEVFNADELEDYTVYIKTNWQSELANAYRKKVGDGLEIKLSDFLSLIENLWATSVHSPYLLLTDSGMSTGFNEDRSVYSDGTLDSTGAVKVGVERIKFADSTEIALGHSYNSVYEMINSVMNTVDTGLIILNTCPITAPIVVPIEMIGILAVGVTGAVVRLGRFVSKLYAGTKGTYDPNTHIVKTTDDDKPSKQSHEIETDAESTEWESGWEWIEDDGGETHQYPHWEYRGDDSESSSQSSSQSSSSQSSYSESSQVEYDR